MRVLGLDPGLTCAGFGLVDDTAGTTRAVAYGALRTKREAVPQRLAALYDQIRALIDEHAPDAIAVERVLFNANTRTAMSVGQAAGIALLAAAQSGCEVAEYTPSEVKLTVTGDGSANKGQMQQMIGRLLDIDPPSPPDAADALGLALTHLRSHKIRRLSEAAGA
ncbi:MAG: crossover junction endodeoxyribonuclease RuvC [Actinomycetota bacterium]